MKVRESRWGILLLLFAACSDSHPGPTFQVERRDFVHRVSAEGELKAASTTALAVPTQVRRSIRLAWVAADGSRVEAGDVVARFDPTEMEEHLEAGRSDFESTGLKADKSRAESEVRVREIETRLQVADLDLDHARRFQKRDDAVFSRHEIVESEIDETLATERKGHAADSRQTQRSRARTELDLLAIQERKARQMIERARAGLSALEVRAPHAGVLTLVRGWSGELPQVGAEMWRGQQIAEIPDLSTLEAEVFVLEADAGGLEVGQAATVVVEADPGTVYPATIRRIDTVAKPRVQGSPVQYFGVALAFNAAESDVAAEQAPRTQARRDMKPGQRVRATLILAEVDDALVVPRQAVVRRAGEAQVLVAGADGFEPRQVAVETSSLGLVVITGGLDGGERIALIPPTGDLTTKEIGDQATKDAAGGDRGPRVEPKP